MEPMPKSPGFSEMISAGAAPAESADPGLFYDDEPLDQILYGEAGGGPAPASLFLSARRHVAAMRAAHASGDIPAMMDAAAALGADDSPVSVSMCLEIAYILTHAVPQIPDPVIAFDLKPLQPLLEKVWRVALDRNHKALQKRASWPLFRWYEHHGRYEDARRVLQKAIGIHVEEGDRLSEAVAANNLAFEYYLEGRLREAIPGFQVAAKLFESLGDTVQQANSLANYWMCRMAGGDVTDACQAEDELQRLAETLDGAGSWQVRKPLIMLARIAGLKGNLEHAKELVQRAIEACVASCTRYPDRDAEYLRQLECGSIPRLEAKGL